MSDEVRWSVDLRWQRPDKPNGFYGIKDSVLMRSSTDPNHVVDFESFDKVDRHVKAKDSTLDIPVIKKSLFTSPGPLYTLSNGINTLSCQI